MLGGSLKALNAMDTLRCILCIERSTLILSSNFLWVFFCAHASYFMIWYIFVLSRRINYTAGP